MIYTLIGAAIAGVLYLYIISAKPAASAKKTDAAPLRHNTPVSAPKAKLRFCPLCSSSMQPGEKLHVEIFKAEPNDKVFLLGCTACLPSLHYSSATDTGSEANEADMTAEEDINNADIEIAPAIEHEEDQREAC